jgi:hypothetical protein
MPAAASKSRKSFFDMRRPINWVIVILLGLSLCSLFGIQVSVFGLSIVPDGKLEGNDASRFEDRAEQIESKLARGPQSPELLLALSLAHLHAGNELRKGMPSKEEAARALQQYREASAAWSKYLNATDSLSPEALQQIAPMFLILGENAQDAPHLKKELRRAVRAYEILAKQSPSINTLMLLAYYRYGAFERKAAQAAGAEALALAVAPAEKARIKSVLAEYAQRTDESEVRLKEIVKTIGASSKEAQK